MSESLFTALVESRNLALNSGDYAGSIREHESILKTATRLARTTSGLDGHRLDSLVDQVRMELDAMQDLLGELSQLSTPSSNGKSSGYPGEPRDHNDLGAFRENDPDVWPPPTAEPAGRNRTPPLRAAGNGNNGPSWARPRESDAQRRQSGGAMVSRRGGSDAPARRAPAEAARMRQERDNSVPSTRKR